jgi:hypothetical protein
MVNKGSFFTWTCFCIDAGTALIENIKKLINEFKITNVPNLSLNWLLDHELVPGRFGDLKPRNELTLVEMRL